MKPFVKPFDAVIDAPFGKVGIRADETSVREIVYLPGEVKSIEPQKALAQEAAAQIRRSFDAPSMRFELPLALGGTEYQRRVWRGISGIAAGQVRYGPTASLLAKSAACHARSVGRAAPIRCRS